MFQYSVHTVAFRVQCGTITCSTGSFPVGIWGRVVGIFPSGRCFCRVVQFNWPVLQDRGYVFLGGVKICTKLGGCWILNCDNINKKVTSGFLGRKEQYSVREVRRDGGREVDWCLNELFLKVLFLQDSALHWVMIWALIFLPAGGFWQETTKLFQREQEEAHLVSWTLWWNWKSAATIATLSNLLRKTRERMALRPCRWVVSLVTTFFP